MCVSVTGFFLSAFSGWTVVVSSSVITVSAPFLASTDFTVIVTVPGWVGVIRTSDLRI